MLIRRMKSNEKCCSKEACFTLFNSALFKSIYNPQQNAYMCTCVFLFEYILISPRISILRNIFKEKKNLVALLLLYFVVNTAKVTLLFFLFFRASPAAYGGSQARARIRAAAAAYTTATVTQDPKLICDLHHRS